MSDFCKVPKRWRYRSGRIKSPEQFSVPSKLCSSVCVRVVFLRSSDHTPDRGPAEKSTVQPDPSVGRWQIDRERGRAFNRGSEVSQSESRRLSDVDSRTAALPLRNHSRIAHEPASNRSLTASDRASRSSSRCESVADLAGCARIDPHRSLCSPRIDGVRPTRERLSQRTNDCDSRTLTLACKQSLMRS